MTVRIEVRSGNSAAAIRPSDGDLPLELALAEVKHEQPNGRRDQPSDAEMEIDTIEAAIQGLQRDKVPITASRIRKRTGPSVSLDEIRQHVAADRFTDRRK
jgi:hypothetical protein